MDKTLYFNNLYDYYQSLLTEKQQQYFEDYYFSNLSLSEMAENYNVSRNAIHRQLKLIEKKLEELEAKLQLLTKKEQVKKLICGNIDEKLEEEIMNIL